MLRILPASKLVPSCLAVAIVFSTHTQSIPHSGRTGVNQLNEHCIHTWVSPGRQRLTFACSATSLVSSEENGKDDMFAAGWCFPKAVSYGSWFASTSAIPILRITGVRGARTITGLDVSNSLGLNLSGVLIFGSTKKSIPLTGTTLLVLTSSIQTILMPAAWTSHPLPVAADPLLRRARDCVETVGPDSNAGLGFLATRGL